MSDPAPTRKVMVTDEHKRVLSTVLAEHEPSLSSYGDVTCLCGEEFRAGESQADSGYRKWSDHVISTFEREGNALWSLRDVDALYR
ncbi:MAG: hypothetical protein M3301_07455 [Chloroflexota bacterium]|nr:hypothetical protein [Chloroflexota bacterium]